MNNTARKQETASTMKTWASTIRFLTPAFLGNAEQGGQWRTPPFKHLLRQWWRVAWAMDNDPAKWKKMRELEGRLFGHAWLENDTNREGHKTNARKSRVRMRLSSWQPGKLKSLPETRPVASRAPVSAFYLGYGPVNSPKTLKMPHPVDIKEDADWHLAWPDNVKGTEYIETALALVDLYGTLGGRSRNAWGSLKLDNLDDPVTSALAGAAQCKEWEDCIRQKWAHAIGSDGRPLIWRTSVRKQWTDVINELGGIRKAVNGLKGDRLVLNQPVGNKGERVPSNLRFKVRQDSRGLYGVVFHMPFSPPKIDPDKAVKVWRGVHQHLDKELKRSDI